MAKYRKKPVVVEAEQFIDGMSLPHRDKGAIVCYDDEGKTGWYVETIHGQRTDIESGDWIIMEPDGIHAYPCKPSIFEATYEPA
jgi:hypothetical protein